MKIELLTEYNEQIANRVRELLIQLSRSGKDRGEIPESWFQDLIASNYHDMLLAINKEGQIVGIAILSVIMEPIMRRTAYLEDFVTDSSMRGQGIGSALWEEMLKWAKEKGCSELRFTSGQDRTQAQAFYKAKGAEIYDTNFFRKTI